MLINSAQRPLEIAAFLDQQGWGDASAQAFDGDFSPRRYARLTHADGRTAILMDADANQKTAHFVGIAKILRDSGIAAPEIYAAALEQGLVLLQDFGTRNIGALIDVGEKPEPYFLRAAETLAILHQNFKRTDTFTLDLPHFIADLFTTQAELFLDAYFPFVKRRDATAEERQDFRAAWLATLRPLDTMPKSLLLRDFMPDNLMDLPDNKIGVLDFQDAGIGCIAYDLASLCDEVRRDGGYALLPAVIAYYRAKSQTTLSQADLTRAATILSALRHTRILGIIAQLAHKTGQRDKLAFLPRIRQHLSNILDENYLVPVREWMKNFESTTS
jgi:aminoglycoside/choline kinase family phosphotransferase